MNKNCVLKNEMARNSLGMIKRPVFFLLIIAWLGLIGLGEFFLLNYEKTPGDLKSAPSQWPPQSLIERHPNQMTLLMFVHPHCPCTRASMDELAVLMTRCHGRLFANVLFLKPKDFSKDWTQTDIWRSAAVIPDVKIKIDEEGREAGRFKASTSGQVLLYDAKGRLLFAGGITASRGHSGDNDGRNAIESLVLRDEAKTAQTPVFGCSLVNQKVSIFQEVLDLWTHRTKICTLKQI